MAADDAVKNLGLRIARWAGIDVSQRLGEVSRWLTMMCHSTDAADIAAMADQILSEDHPLLPDLVRSLTVSHTRFFRDIEQLDAVETLLRRGPSQMRVWVAGCSTGEEAYSVALLALAQHRKIEIVASDVNQASLDAARAGVYPPEAIERIPRRFLFDFTNRGSYIEVSPRMRQAVRIVHHNLMKPPLRPTDGSGWDIILCRNVLIHFRAEHAAQALDKLALALAPGGHLFLGTSEFHQRTPRLVPVHVANRIALQRPTR
ncbi:MAG TPA: CheR family methyltransferase, partial [Pseudomonadota bacterium]|nr:CheR family methyltransferase [Pseudomonadota bacterium]